MFTKHPGGDGCHSFGVRSDGRDVIEDVDENKEESDEESHSARNNLGRNEEADPGGDNKQS